MVLHEAINWAQWRGVRAVYRPALLKLQGVKSLASSNLALSATQHLAVIGGV